MFPLIFAALSAAPKLFDAGKAVYNAITGQPSDAATPEALQGQVAALTPEQQQAWAAAMNAQIEIYRAETERLKVEEGEVTPELLQVLDPEARAKLVAYRMETRPLIARMMAWVILAPLGVVAFDATALLVNATFDRHVMLLAPILFGAASLYAQIYGKASTAAMSIVMSYMIVRGIEKAAGAADSGSGLTGALQGAAGAVQGVVNAFRKK